MLCTRRDSIVIPYALSRRSRQMEVEARDDSAVTNAHQITESTEAGDDTATEEGNEAEMSDCSEIHVLPLSPHKSNDNNSPELTKDDDVSIKPNRQAFFKRFGGGRKYINTMFGSSRDVVTKDRIKPIKTEVETILEAKPVDVNASENVQQSKEPGHTHTNLQLKISETPKTQEFIIGHADKILDSIASDISEILSPHTNATITQKSGEKSTIEGRSTNIIQYGPSIKPKIEIPTILHVLEDVCKGTADLLLDVYDDVFPLLPLDVNGELSFCTCIGNGRGGSEERYQYDCLDKSISLEHTAQHGLLTGIQVVNYDEYNPSETEIAGDTPIRSYGEVGDSVDSVASSFLPEPVYQFQMNSYQHAQGEPYRQYPGVPSQSSSGLIPPSISSLTATAQLGKIYPPPNPVHNEIIATEDIVTGASTAKCQRGTTSSTASIMISNSSSEDNIDERQDRYAIEEEAQERDLTPTFSPTRMSMINPPMDRYHVSDNTIMIRQDHQGMHVMGADSTSYTTMNNHKMTTQEQYLATPKALTTDYSAYNNLHHMQHQVHQISHQHHQSESKKLASFAC